MTDHNVEDTSLATLQASPAGIAQFHNSNFGLSAHWGLYALNKTGSEWAYLQERIELETYKKRMSVFNPIDFNPEQWADLMSEAGAKFFIITSKHHDGFCLWDTDLTDFKSTNSRFGRDILQELVEPLRERGIALHFYYSLMDWTHPAYRTDWPEYVAYYQGQLRELCTQFGDLGGIIFDGYWPRMNLKEETAADYCNARGEWDLAGSYDLIHELQPNAVIANNTHVLPLKGEDYQVWELDLPGENTRFSSNCTDIGNAPTATWWNLNEGWSYQPSCHNVKSPEEIVTAYKGARSHDSTFILNVGPRDTGDIHPDEQTALRQIGKLIR